MFDDAGVVWFGFEKNPEGMFDVFAVVVICLNCRVVMGLSGNVNGYPLLELDPYS